MAEQIVLAPTAYWAIKGKSMLQRPTWCVCEQCGHTVIPDDPGFKCSCRKCLAMRRAA
jgi:hypothetical protein